MVQEDDGDSMDKETESFLWGGTATTSQLSTLRRKPPAISSTSTYLNPDDLADVEERNDDKANADGAQEIYWKTHRISERQRQAMEEDVDSEFLDRLERDILRAVRIGQNEAIKNGRRKKKNKIHNGDLNIPKQESQSPSSKRRPQQQQFPPIFIPMAPPEDVSIGGEPCPICDEIMKKMTWKGIENVRQSCCGTLLCRDCSIFNTDYCPSCRDSRPATQEEVIQQTLEFAQNHKAWAQYQYAQYLSQDRNRLSKPLYIRKRAITWAELAAQRGYTPAYGLLAKLYEEQKDDKFDPNYFEGDETSQEKAFAFYVKAAKLGNDARAQYWLGEYYEKLEEYAQSLYWTQQSTVQDYPPALESMGNKHLKGLGVEKSKEMASFWFDKLSGESPRNLNNQEEYDYESSQPENDDAYSEDQMLQDESLFGLLQDSTGAIPSLNLLDCLGSGSAQESYGLYGYGDPQACKEDGATIV